MIPPQPPQQGNDLKLDGLTRQQIKKIEKSMKKPQFMGLLNEYMVEISDPKNKAEYDQYLKQMEKEGELPKHMKLVKLEPQFCFRTFIISSRNKTHEMKFFINMCSTDYIEKPSCQPAKDQSGGVGYNWKVPNSIGKIRYDQDRHQKPCQVVDVAFHPDTFFFAASHPQFQAMIISIALQGVERQLGQRKQTLSRDYNILKNIKCKGENGEPALLPIRYIEGKAYNRGEGPAEQERGLQGKQTKLQKEINKQKEEHEQEKKKNQKEKPGQSKVEAIQDEDLSEEGNKKLVQDLEQGTQAPKYTSIYTYKTDYSQFIDDSTTAKKARKLPNMFTVEFKVPRMENISQADTLEINEKKIIFAIKDKYFIDISFDQMKVKSYPLKYSEAKAKFDKKKKTLRVQIPVDVSAIPEQQLISAKEQIQNQQSKEEQNKIVGEKIIEQETWKNKVLEIPQQVQTSKFLSQAQTSQQSKPVKKLIQQIDEDDYIEEKKPQQQVQQQQIQQGEKQQQRFESKPFSISQYYEPVKADISKEQILATRVQKLNYIFKQTNKYLTIMVYMRNYKQDDIKVVLNELNGQFIVLWLNKAQPPSVVHICLTKQKRSEAKKIEILKRVGFYTLIAYKLKEGEIWGENCIQNRFISQTVQKYQEIINKIQEGNKEIIKKRQQQQKRIEEENQSKNKNNNEEKIVQKIQKIQQKDSNIEQIDDNVPEQKPKMKTTNPEIEPTSLFQKLPIQFLRFNAPFIDTLN